MPMTPPQEQVWSLVREWPKKHGWPPSVREIAETLGYRSTTTVRNHIRALEKKGWLVKGGGARMLKAIW